MPSDPKSSKTVVKPVRKLVTREDRIYEKYRAYMANPSLEHLKYGTKFVPGIGSMHPKVLFLSNIPTEAESKSGVPLVGREKQVMFDVLQASGLTFQDVFYTHVLKYRPPNGRNPRESEFLVSSDTFWAEVDILKPEVIVLLGRYAASVVFPGFHFSDVQGVVVEEKTTGLKYLTMYHLTQVLTAPSLRGPMSEMAVTLGEAV